MSNLSNRARTVTLMAFLLFTLAVMLLPGIALAQDEPVVDDVTILVGAVQIAPDGTISVEGIVVDYSAVTLPDPLNDGDLVIVVGTLVDDTTLQATSFLLFDDEPVEDDMDNVDGDEMEDDPTYVCGDLAHPLALRISEAFDTTPDEVMAMHCEGNGFGNIVRAYLLAEASAEGDEPMTPEDLIALHHSGTGWGNIIRVSDVHPSDLAPGQIRNRNKDDVDDTGDETSEMTGTTPANTNPGNGRGNSGNNGNNGNNGNGNNNGNNNGNGNGNNGNGRGNNGRGN